MKKEEVKVEDQQEKITTDESKQQVEKEEEEEEEGKENDNQTISTIVELDESTINTSLIDKETEYAILAERRRNRIKSITLQRDSLIKMIFRLAKIKANILSADKVAQNIVSRWIDGRVSNYQYLMYLNIKAGRSRSDLSQYFIFPWIIQDYTSKVLDLNNANTFRDLSLPIGALNSKLWHHYEERYNDFNQDLSQIDEHTIANDDHLIPPFHYGSHYSTIQTVLYYLIRKSGYSQLNRSFQGGEFDIADRLFDSIENAWNLCFNHITDVKECIPEFYEGDTSFLINKQNLELGTKQTGDKVDDIILPTWANSPIDFLRKNKAALESPYVSKHLHQWIDLIFGYKQRGQEAIEAKNVFFHLTYSENNNIDQIINPELREATELQIINFGQIPKQLFTSPHPHRKVGKTIENLKSAASEKLDITRNSISQLKGSIKGSIHKRLSSARTKLFAFTSPKHKK